MSSQFSTSIHHDAVWFPNIMEQECWNSKSWPAFKKKPLSNQMEVYLRYLKRFNYVGSYEEGSESSYFELTEKNKTYECKLKDIKIYPAKCPFNACKICPEARKQQLPVGKSTISKEEALQNWANETYKGGERHIQRHRDEAKKAKKGSSAYQGDCSVM